ncbi:acetylcholinesterase-like [Aricia agestis]|uniref:acetylcholinesterase-like n=1 Tax=Aricia agestis TaxID=91739 RepID=UPI001C207AC3|nr:acetylcholinesterase-like [Aricia agestis]
MAQFYYILLICFGLTYARERIDPLVDTKQGLIRGLKADDGDYSMFLGIPYATVDKSNPFGSAIPQQPFEAVFEAYDDSAKCPQVDEFSNKEEGTLDCLHINIYVPNNATSRNKLPVLVWIYGGAFEIGYSGRYLYGPKFLIRNDVILVTFNYRVGPYGFFCLDIPEVPGNQGLKDQVLALRWIKDNIEAFGGDSNQITAMGESAGAASVELHILSPQEKLFNKAIVQSGSSVAPWVLLPPTNDTVYQISEKLGYISNNLLESLSFLATVDPLLVIAASEELGINYRACVEKPFEGVESFLSEHPENVEISKTKVMPILNGYNNKENLIANPDNNPGFYWSGLFHSSMDILFDLDKDMEDIVTNFYIGDEEISDKVKSELIDFLSDVHFNYPAQRSIYKYIKSGVPNVYHYIFSYDGGRNFVKKNLNITDAGVCHADEIGYLFDISYDKDFTEEDQLIIDRITTLWTNFVKYGDPTPEPSKLIPIKWTPITENVLHYLDINTELSMGTRPFHDRLAFWDLFYIANHENLRALNYNRK